MAQPQPPPPGTTDVANSQYAQYYPSYDSGYSQPYYNYGNYGTPTGYVHSQQASNYYSPAGIQGYTQPASTYGTYQQAAQPYNYAGTNMYNQSATPMSSYSAGYAAPPGTTNTQPVPNPPNAQPTPPAQGYQQPQPPALDSQQTKNVGTAQVYPNQYTAPAGSGNQYTAPAGSNSQYTAPAGSNSQYTAPAGSNSQYTAPAGSNNQYSGPAGSNNQYTAPAGSNSQYSGPAGSNNQYSGPASSNNQYSGPAGSNTSGRGSQAPYSGNAPKIPPQPNTSAAPSNTASKSAANPSSKSRVGAPPGPNTFGDRSQDSGAWNDDRGSSRNDSQQSQHGYDYSSEPHRYEQNQYYQDWGEDQSYRPSRPPTSADSSYDNHDANRNANFRKPPVPNQQANTRSNEWNEDESETFHKSGPRPLMANNNNWNTGPPRNDGMQRGPRPYSGPDTFQRGNDPNFNQSFNRPPSGPRQGTQPVRYPGPSSFNRPPNQRFPNPRSSEPGFRNTASYNAMNRPRGPRTPPPPSGPPKPLLSPNSFGPSGFHQNRFQSSRPRNFGEDHFGNRDDGIHEDHFRSGDDGLHEDRFRSGDDGLYEDHFRSRDDGTHEDRFRSRDDGIHDDRFRSRDDGIHDDRFRSRDGGRHEERFRERDDRPNVRGPESRRPFNPPSKRPNIAEHEDEYVEDDHDLPGDSGCESESGESDGDEFDDPNDVLSSTAVEPAKPMFSETKYAELLENETRIRVKKLRLLAVKAFHSTEKGAIGKISNSRSKTCNIFIRHRYDQELAKKWSVGVVAHLLFDGALVATSAARSKKRAKRNCYEIALQKIYLPYLRICYGENDFMELHASVMPFPPGSSIPRMEGVPLAPIFRKRRRGLKGDASNFKKGPLKRNARQALM